MIKRVPLYVLWSSGDELSVFNGIVQCSPHLGVIPVFKSWDDKDNGDNESDDDGACDDVIETMLTSVF